jgi:hypothetical protein
MRFLREATLSEEIMTRNEFETCLAQMSEKLGHEARTSGFASAKAFEMRVREAAIETIPNGSALIDAHPHPQAFPDIEAGEFGIEVKFTLNDEWRCVANSIQETNRIGTVKSVYLMYAKMGGTPDVQWGHYDQCVVHVRTSHVPRFEVEIGAKASLFDRMGVSYDSFRNLDMHEKMGYVREYARARLSPGERLWWLDDAKGLGHTLPAHVRLFTNLGEGDKIRLRAEAIILCPQVLDTGRARHKYDDVALYMLTCHGVLCHQARDMFSAGSVSNPSNDDHGGLYIARMLRLMEPEIEAASRRLEDALFREYWGATPPDDRRLVEWLIRANRYAGHRWTPSRELFNGRFHEDVRIG